MNGTITNLDDEHLDSSSPFDDGMTELPMGKVPNDQASEWGPLLHYMEPVLDFYQTPGVTEIMINRFDKIFIEKDGKMELTNARFKDNGELERFIHYAGNLLDQPFSVENPILDARFPDCSRLCCTRSNVSIGSASVTLRIAPKVPLTSKMLLDYGSLTEEMFEYIQRIVEGGANIIVSGSTGSGKTSLLRVLTEFINPDLRVITCEDTQDLFLNLPNTIAMEAPKRRLEGQIEAAEEITLSRLIKTTLRQRPDRIWVGEIRDKFAADAFLQAINTGHTGCATTIHSNGCADTVERIQYLLAAGGLLSYELARKVLLGGITVLVHAGRKPTYGRKITEIVEVVEGDLLPMYVFNEDTLQHDRYSENLSRSKY